MHLQNKLVFLWSPLSSDNRGVNNIVPSLSALSTESPGQISSYYHPVLSSIVADLLSQDSVLLLCPLVAGANLFWLKLDHGGGELKAALKVADLHFFSLGRCLIDFFEIKPSFKASNLCFVHHELAKSMPWLVAVNVNQSFQFLVLHHKNHVRDRISILTSSYVQTIFSAGVFPTLVLFLKFKFYEFSNF